MCSNEHCLALKMINQHMKLNMSVFYTGKQNMTTLSVEADSIYSISLDSSEYDCQSGSSWWTFEGNGDKMHRKANNDILPNSKYYTAFFYWQYNTVPC